MPTATAEATRTRPRHVYARTPYQVTLPRGWYRLVAGDRVLAYAPTEMDARWLKAVFTLLGNLSTAAVEDMARTADEDDDEVPFRAVLEGVR
ncbi:MAG TPA: hypothetical protein VD948_08780 [Rhodothermales bacterium]|nr:hypothetical protein [Rhodothermales bacterium]